jgi:hypothetical protein
MNSALALQQAMRSALLTHAPLKLLLGGEHVYDEVPRGQHPPYVAFTSIDTRDWSTIELLGDEHIVTIEVVTNERGKGHAHEIVEAIDFVLDRARLTLNGHRLINLAATFWNVSRGKDGTFGGTLKFRATTEPL